MEDVKGKSVSSVVDVNCSEGRRRARTKLGGMSFHSSCFRFITKTHVLLLDPCTRAGRPREQKAFDQHRHGQRRKDLLMKRKVNGRGMSRRVRRQRACMAGHCPK